MVTPSSIPRTTRSTTTCAASCQPRSSRTTSRSSSRASIDVGRWPFAVGRNAANGQRCTANESRDLLQHLDRLRLLLVLHIRGGDLLEVGPGLIRLVALQMRARGPEPGVDEIFVFAEAVGLHGTLERHRGVVIALLRVIDAAEVREGVEEV